jgi:hypothetical protein
MTSGGAGLYILNNNAFLEIKGSPPGSTEP